MAEDTSSESLKHWVDRSVECVHGNISCAESGEESSVFSLASTLLLIEHPQGSTKLKAASEAYLQKRALSPREDPVDDNRDMLNLASFREGLLAGLG